MPETQSIFYIYILTVLVLLMIIMRSILQMERREKLVLEFMDNALDNMNKLAQLGMIHAGSADAAAAVATTKQHEQNTLDLEAAKKAIEEELTQPKKSKRKLVGFNKDGVFFKFERPPTEGILSKIPESARVYEEIH